MDGMKSGAGDDPFADAGDDADDEPDRDVDADDPESVATEASETTSQDTGASAGSTSLPWIYARENAKSGREMVQFFLQEETKAMESDAVDELEGWFSDDSVRVFDVREAAYQVALTQHLDDVADQLREWGYDVE